MGLLCALSCSSPSPSPGLVTVPEPVRKHTEWSVALSGSGDVDIASVARGRDGALYVGGSLSGEVRAAGRSVRSVGPSDGFVAKLSSAGAVQWLRTYGSPGRDRVTAVAVANDVLWLAVGRGRDASVIHALTDGTGYGLKFQLAASGFLVIRDMAVTAQGGVVVVGHYTGDLRLDKHRVTSAGASDGFIARFAPNGKPMWLRRFGGPWSDHAHAVSVRGDVIAVAGSFTRSAYFDSTLVDSRGRSQDAFLARYDGHGRVRWVKPMGGDRRDATTAVAIDAGGVIYAGGSFAGAASFGAEPIVAVDGPDAFVVAHTVAGKNLWTRRFGGSSAERIVAMTTAGKRVYLAGEFIGTTRIKDYAIRGERKHDGFIAAFTQTGDVHAARPVSGKGDVAVRDLVVDSKGAVIVAGSLLGASEVVPGKPLANDDEHTSGFVARLSP